MAHIIDQVRKNIEKVEGSLASVEMEHLEESDAIGQIHQHLIKANEKKLEEKDARTVVLEEEVQSAIIADWDGMVEEADPRGHQ